jgi:hypothetical protein
MGNSSVLDVRISCHVIAVFVFWNPIFTVILAPKRKSIDAGSYSKPKRSRDVLCIIEKVKIPDMNEIGNNRMLRLPGCMDRTILPFVNWWRPKKKYTLVFLLHRKLQKLTAILPNKVLMKLEKPCISGWKIWIERGYPSLLQFIITLILVMSYCA